MEKEPLSDGGEHDRAPRHQMFVFGAFLFNVDRALGIIAEAPRQTRPIQVAAWARFFGFDLSDDGGIALFAPKYLDPDYAMTTALENPVLIATLRHQERSYPLLIDGTHRVYKAHKLSVETLPAYVLSDDESLAIRDDPFVRSRLHWQSEDPARAPGNAEPAAGDTP